MSAGATFWDDLVRDLEDPEFLREYIIESVRIATIDTVVNELDEARQAAGMTKADLARAIRSDPATVRRLFSSDAANPTLGTLAEVAAVLGCRVTIEPLPDDERALITSPLVEGAAPDPRGLACVIEGRRSRRPGVRARSGQ